MTSATEKKETRSIWMGRMHDTEEQYKVDMDGKCLVMLIISNKNKMI